MDQLPINKTISSTKQLMENLVQSPYYLGESTYKYDLRDYVQKLWRQVDNHISPLQLHRLHLQSARKKRIYYLKQHDIIPFPK